MTVLILAVFFKDNSSVEPVLYVIYITFYEWNNSNPTGRIFTKFNIWEFLKICREHSNFIKTRIGGTLHEVVCILTILSRWIFHRMRNVWDKSCRESQNTHFTFGNVFLKIVSFVRLGFTVELFLFLKCYILRFRRLRNQQNVRVWDRLYRYAYIRYCIIRIQSGYMVYG